MQGIEIARKVIAEGVHVFRVREGQTVITPPAGNLKLGAWEQPAPIEYDAKPWPGGNKRGWVMLDSFTAGHIVAVANGLNPENLAKFSRYPLHVMAKVAFTVLGKQPRGKAGNYAG
jgi:hypothetical protein